MPSFPKMTTFTNRILVDSSTNIWCMSPFVILGGWGGTSVSSVLFYFDGKFFYKQCRPLSDATSCVCTVFALFAYGPFTGFEFNMGELCISLDCINVHHFFL